MSVYTAVSSEEVRAFLSGYSIGNLTSYRGIENGITNTNYWLSTDSGNDYVLTIYEHHQSDTLDYMLGLQQYLAEKGVACSRPIVNDQHRLYSTLKGKPAAIINRVPGKVYTKLGAQHCAHIGRELAKFHHCGASFPLQRRNPCGPQWRIAKQQQLSPLLSDSDNNVLADEINAYRQLDILTLPGGPTHSDLFHDNCLFKHNRLCGIIDFDYACNEHFIYDIAVCLNDCCIEPGGELATRLCKSLLDAYQSIRPLLAIELNHLALMLRVAATRFWLSRLYDWHFPMRGEMTFRKDPDVFKNILLLRRSDCRIDHLFTDTES